MFIMSVSREIDEKLLILTSLIFPSEIIFDKVSCHNIKNFKVRQKYFAARRIDLSSHGLILRSSDLCIIYDLKVRNFWDTSLTAFPMGLPKVHVSGKNPSSGNSWKELFAAPLKHSLALYTPASTQATTDVDTCLSGYYIRSGPFLESSFKFSRPESCFVCAFFLMYSRSKFQ